MEMIPFIHFYLLEKAEEQRDFMNNNFMQELKKFSGMFLNPDKFFKFEL